MLKALKIPASRESPEIIFTADSGELSIKGQSLMENVSNFYNPLKEWLETYATEVAELTHLVIQLDYYNSGTARQLMELFFILETLKQKGKQVILEWCYQKGDFSMKENGEEMIDLIDLEYRLTEMITS